MADVTRRLRYFDGQVLGAQDFTDEQAYILDRQHRYSRFLHAAGIVEGLEVRTAGAPGQIEVRPGTALDAQGRQVVLSAPRPISLAALPDKTVTVFIAYGIAVRENDPTHWEEEPYVSAHIGPLSENTDDLPTDFLPLATLTLDAQGAVTQIDETPRVYAGIRLPNGQGETGGVVLRAHTRPGNLDQAVWHPVAFANGWHQYGTENPVQCWKDSQGLVHLHGRMQPEASTPPGVVLRLPEGYRPTLRQCRLLYDSDVLIEPSGEVASPSSSQPAWVSLDGITFQAADSPGGASWSNVTNHTADGASWGSFPQAPLQCWKDNRGIVYLRGMIEGAPGYSRPSAAQLETGYRPTHRQRYIARATASEPGIARVDILPDGTVEVVSSIVSSQGALLLIWFDGIAFPSTEIQAWSDVAYCNNWQRYDDSFAPVQYWKDSEGIVYLRGLMQGGAIGAENDAGLAFTLPAGYRPASPQVHRVCTSSDDPNARVDVLPGRVDVLPNGNVVVVTGSKTWVGLDGLAFRAERPQAALSEDVLPRIVSGIVDGSGSTQSTLGCTVTRVSSGLYEITFAPAFAATPAATVTLIGDVAESSGGSTLQNAVLVSLEAARIRVKTGDPTGIATDRSFSFIAVGPR